jgi:Flp pilus assembly protein CpaB
VEATTSRSRIGGNAAGQLLSSRRGGATVAILAAGIAGVLLFVFIHQYRKSVDKAVAQVPVFVASGFIPHGTPAAVVSSQNLVQRTTVKHDQTLSGAISDPSQLVGQVAVKDIAPGQQLRVADFAPGNPTLASYLTGTARAIELPVDATHGLSGYVSPGDHVDVLSSSTGTVGNSGAATTIAQDLLVMSTGNGGGGGGIVGGGGGNSTGIVVRATDKQALTLALAADNGKVWIILRPPLGAQQSTAVGAKAGQ